MRLFSERLSGLYAGFYMLMVATIFSGCTGSASEEAISRGRDTWVFRSVLDEKARMATVALQDSFWLAYDSEYGSLFKIWKEGVTLDGPVYTSAHGPQPTTNGDAFTINKYRHPWRIITGKDTITPIVQYRGHLLKDGKVYFQYELSTEDQFVRVIEHPEFDASALPQPILLRAFEVSGLANGSRLGLLSDMQSLSYAGGISTNGEWKVYKSKELIVPGNHVLSTDGILMMGNGSYFFNCKFHHEPMVKKPVVNEEKIDPALLLIEQSGCKTCHNIEKQTVGPAYIAVAERYKTNPFTVEMLVNKVRQGGSGNWGSQVMNPHPHLSEEDVEVMVNYILNLDMGEELSTDPTNATPSFEMGFEEADPNDDVRQGLVASAWYIEEIEEGMGVIPEGLKPVQSGVVGGVHVIDPQKFQAKGFRENFMVVYSGDILIPESSKYVFRLTSDDGSRLYIDDQLIVDNGGYHGMFAVDGEVILEEGQHSIKVEFFNGGGGMGVSLQWIKYGEESFTVIPSSAFRYRIGDVKDTEDLLESEEEVKVAGDGLAVDGVHPSFTLEKIRPDGFKPKVGGLDLLSDGRVVVSTWDPEGSVYILDPSRPEDETAVKRIATGLAEPLGLKVVEDEIYVLQKQELTHLIDHDGDELIDEYKTLCNDWEVSDNFHEFAFGLVYQDGYFYATLATAILPGGASKPNQTPDRGKAVRISKEDGSVSYIAQGLRTPNGIGEGADGEIYIADNQGDWLPSSKILHLEEDAWYGSRSVDFEGTAQLTETPPVVWLPQDEIGNSPTQPSYLKDGPYNGQLIYGEVTHGGIKRVNIEKVNGVYQGCLFRFSQGLEAGVNRLAWGNDGALYVGGIGSTGNWQHYGRYWYGLQRLKYNGTTTFEMLSVHALSDGFEIQLTAPLAAGLGTQAAEYMVEQWKYVPTAEYGGPKVNQENLKVSEVRLSEDNTKISLKIEGLKAGHIVYFRLPNSWKSRDGANLWSTEAWYTLNQIPSTNTNIASN